MLLKNKELLNIYISLICQNQKRHASYHMGAFCTNRFWVDETSSSKEISEYNSIMVVTTLIYMRHSPFARKIRKALGGYASDENISAEEWLQEYKGICPAPGYPACPDHLETTKSGKLWMVETRNRCNLDWKYGDVARFNGFGLLFRKLQSK
jgi:5-methyltetrahydrofolate--homocysteine methyltransferase